MDITKKIKTFEDACQVLNLDPTHLPIVDLLPEKDRKSLIAYYKLTIIIRALNEGWEPNWHDNTEYKYYNYLNISSGSSFHFSDAAFTATNAYISSNLCFKSRYLAMYAYYQFNYLYLDFLFIK